MDSIQTLLQQACDDIGDVECRSYSGRGMYGRQCVGLTGSRHDIGRVVTEVVDQLVQAVFDDAIDAESDEDLKRAYKTRSDVQDLISKLLSDQQSDSMGLDIVIYWPRLEWVEDEEEDDTDEG